MNIKEINRIGWDVGGAHLKAVLVDPAGRVLQAMQTACPLWKGMDQLELAVDRVLFELGSADAFHAVTMTGELADIFLNRFDGVNRIAELMQHKLGPGIQFYAAQDGLVELSRVPMLYRQIASANWHASASHIAGKLSHGVLIDIGSTTTDIILLCDGMVANTGFSDAERLRENELVYTGVARTPLMALAQTIDFKGYHYRVAAEHFATTADVYEITGELMAAEDMSATADGAEKGVQASMRRLARMLGHDKEDAVDTDWIALAQAFKSSQLQQLETAVSALLARGRIGSSVPIIAAGAGSFLVKQLAVRLERQYIPLENLIAANTDSLQHWAAICFPAYAVSCLVTSP